MNTTNLGCDGADRRADLLDELANTANHLPFVCGRAPPLYLLQDLIQIRHNAQDVWLQETSEISGLFSGVCFRVPRRPFDPSKRFEALHQ